MPSPLDVDKPHAPGWAGKSAWADSWAEVWELRQGLAGDS